MKMNFKPGFLAGLALALAAVAGGAQAAYGYQGNYYDSRNRDDGYGYTTSRSVRCDSRDGRTNYCRMDTRGGVSLIGQTSQSACIRGQTWGVTRDSIWVTRGCRGRFAATGYRQSGYGDSGNRYDDRYNDRSDDRYDDRYDERSDQRYNNRSDNRYSSNSGRAIRCESRDGRYNFCGSSGYGGRVQLRRQLSDSNCRLNVSWGTRNGGIWVDRGCRAEFVIY